MLWWIDILKAGNPLHRYNWGGQNSLSQIGNHNSIEVAAKPKWISEVFPFSATNVYPLSMEWKGQRKRRDAGSAHCEKILKMVSACSYKNNICNLKNCVSTCIFRPLEYYLVLHRSFGATIKHNADFALISSITSMFFRWKNCMPYMPPSFQIFSKGGTEKKWTTLLKSKIYC